MAVTVPRFALGLDVPNPTFSIPSATAGLAGGWTPSQYAIPTALYGAGPTPGHARAQRFTFSQSGQTSATVLSGPCGPGKLTANVSTAVMGFALVRTSGIAGSAAGTVKFRLKYYDDADSLLSSTDLISLTLVGQNYADWTALTGATSVTPPATANHARLEIALGKTTLAVPVVLDVAFAGVGTWRPDAVPASYYEPTRTPAHPGTFCVPSGTVQRIKSTSGTSRTIDGDRYRQPHVGTMLWGGLPDADKIEIEYAYRMNVGRTWEGDVANPSGGSWPLIVKPGRPDWPAIGLYEIVGFDARPSGGFYSDPPYHDVTLRLEEIV